MSVTRGPTTTSKGRTSRLRAAAASGLTLTSGLAAPSVAHGREWDLRGDAGVFVAFHFGGGSGVGVGMGMEARAAYVDVTYECDRAQRMFAGLVGRLEVVDFKRVRLTAGPVIGRGNGATGFAGEVTGGIAAGKDAGRIVHLSAEAAGGMLFNARLGYTVMRDWQVGLGVRFPPINRASWCVTGRPLHDVDGRALVQGASVALPPGASPAEGDARARASSVWMRRACLEWASVPAFCELAEQLKACGAPPVLVSRARQAAAEELGHAVASGEVAASLGGMTCVSLDPPLTQPRPVASGVEGLRRLALESWSDGCIGESASALIARRECAQAGDPAIARVQALIALQESNHAELAWEVVEWALGADRASVGPLLAASAVVAPMSNQGGATTTSGDGLSAFGILPAASAGALQDQALARAHAHLTERLGG